MMLDEKHTCFVRDGKTFCKKDYIRWEIWETSGGKSIIQKNPTTRTTGFHKHGQLDFYKASDSISDYLISTFPDFFFLKFRVTKNLKKK